MDEKLRKELEKKTAPAEILFDCAMKDYTTFRVGGKADAICFPENGAQLKNIVSCLAKKGVPYLIAGKGSNLLVRDGGIKGAVIILKGKFAIIERDADDKCSVNAGAGLPLCDLLSYCGRNGLGGAEFLAGIPGTLGGAVAMNAGAHGKEIKGLVKEVHILTAKGIAETIDSSHLDFDYRKLSLAEGSILQNVLLHFEAARPEIISAKIAEFLKQRKKYQPLEYPSGGSVFKNPPGDFAGRLIEEAGLKGKTIGNAMISEKHANFIVNTGNAMAVDILALMDLAQKRVRERTGIDLEPEIRVVGMD
jgi:UDP-N-acetylmuramate dehydrogenase